jgi:hypothetical protein
LELRARDPAADIDVLRCLQEEPCALDLLQLRSQPGDHLSSRDIALALGLEGDEEPAVVEGRRGATRAQGHGVGGHRWVLGDDITQRLLAAHHFSERHILRRFRDAGDEARVLLRG